ncbi:MAG: SMC-Scp complex subunit ScpB [Proteobacteria bacterium]|nr:MAG: SMC-Scp complex subunit ScpB [Pseudomonadota bacterium]
MSDENEPQAEAVAEVAPAEADAKPEQAERQRILEALLLASAEPVTAARLGRLVPQSSAREVREDLAALNERYEAEGRGFRVEEVAGGHQLRTLPELASFVQSLEPVPPLRMSRAALESLAIIAYKQPVTRAEVEHVRGVDAGPVLRSLLERRLIRIAGHREVPGRPILYATTPRFLEIFGLASLSDLPTLREIEELLRERLPEAGEMPDAAALAEAFASATEGGAAADADAQAASDASDDADVPPQTH